MGKRRPAGASKKRSTAGKAGNQHRADLTDEQKRLIITSIEAGGTFDSAARAAGLAPRTLREYRQRARGKHPNRSPLPHLRRFFQDVDQAVGRRLLANEIWVNQNDPKFALKYLRASLDADGEDEDPPRLPTAGEIQEEIDVLIATGTFRSPRCQQSCSCLYHASMGDAS
jgi:hypothetical protein